MRKETQQLERRGLPGGPNEMFTYTTGVFSTEGFRMDSPDVNNYQNIIPSGSISMKERDGSPLRKGPIHGVDNLGYAQVMYPGFDYQFPGTEVTETLMAKMGGALLDKTIKCGNCGWEWKAADGGSDVMDCHKCGGKGLVKAQGGIETKLNPYSYDKSDSSLRLNPFLSKDPESNIFIGGISPSYSTKDFSIEASAVGVGNKDFMELPADYGIRGSYNPTDSLSINAGLSKNNIGAGVSYRFKNGGDIAQVGLETNVEDGIEKFNTVQNWFNEYTNSPLYKENLIKSGYRDPQAIINERLANINTTKFENNENRLGSYYRNNKINYSPIKDKKNSPNNEGDDTIAHEFGHSSIDAGDFFTGFKPGYNKYDYEQLIKRNKNPKISRGAHENYADLKAIQYEAEKAGIYKPGYEPFTKEHLDKLKNTDHKLRALENYSEEDLIWLENNIAQVDDQSQLPIAQLGIEKKPLGAGKYYTTTGKVVDWGTPEYEAAYNRGEVLSEDGVRSEVTLEGGVLPEIVLQNNYKRNFWEQYRDKIVEENKDAGVLGAAVGVPISAVFSLPQLALMNELTGKVQRPSEAWGFENNEGWFDNPSSFGKNLANFTLDAVTDPTDWIGVGELTTAGRLAKSKLRKTFPGSISPELREGLRTQGLTFNGTPRKYPINSYQRSATEDVDKLFEEFPELAKIGSKEDYIKHLETIHPETTQPGIFYRGSNQSNNPSEWVPNPSGGNNLGEGFYFTPDSFKAQNYGKEMKALLDIKDPTYTSLRLNTNGLMVPSGMKAKDIVGEGSAAISIQNPNRNLFTEMGSRAEGYMHKYKGPLDEQGFPAATRPYETNPDFIDYSKIDELVVPDNSQIHVLGSDIDKELFKNYINKLKQKEGGELTEYQKKGEVKIDLKHSQDIYDQIRPSDYTSLGNYGRYLFGISRGEDEYDDARSEEAFKQYLGLNSKPKYLSVSKYAPSIKGEGKKGDYYKVDPQLEQDIFYSYKDKLKLNQVLPTGEDDVKSDFPEGTPMTSDGYVKLDPYDDNLLVGRPMVSRARMLGNFNVSRGKDEKGEYISYSDQYDFPGVMQSRMKGKPYKIYNRIYYNDMKEEGGETITPADTTAPSPLVEYVVKKGDTLSKIAAANNTSIRSIMKNNESISDPNIISINQKINIVNKNVDAPGEQVYKDWNTIRDKKDKINKLSDEQKIVTFHNDKPEETYLIVDKKNAVMKLYTGGNLTKSFEVGVGQNPGDAQTVTKVKDGKTDWTGGNKSTGAGIYTISNINPASEEYYNEPAFNLKNENGIEVATTIHGTPKPRRIKFNNGTVVDNRMSNGCINGKCQDLKELYGQLDINTKVYILPEDAGNNFQIIDGKPALKVSSQNRQRYNSYIDQTGTKQKGQGANQTTNTLVYKPVKAYIDETKFKDDVFQWNDFNDEKEYASTTKPFIAALTTGKKDIMKAAKISSDVYNELAKMSFGIYGTESNFGDTHSAVGNLARATNKFLDPKSSSSPDYKAKASTYGADENSRSVGLTQLRWNYLNVDEKKALKEVGITSNKDFLDPKKAAIGTVTVLGVRYNQQLNDKQKQDVWKYLPTKWNNRANYSDRVKSNSSYLSFKQLDKKEYGGESKPGSLMQAYNKLTMEKKMGGVIANKKQFGGQLNSGNITMYRDYIKGTIGNETEAIKNYDKLNRIYYTKAKESGMTVANYIMTYIANNS